MLRLISSCYKFKFRAFVSEVSSKHPLKLSSDSGELKIKQSAILQWFIIPVPSRSDQLSQSLSSALASRHSQHNNHYHIWL